jgi:hypothetical protein
MKSERIELTLEGTHDGETWQALPFRYKPGDPDGMTPFIVPHQPRIDWMMWFVPMHPMFGEWFDRFLVRLLEGSPEVTARLAADPFPAGPPREIRVSAWRYRFTEPATRAETGAWWEREYLGPFWGLPGRAAPEERAAAGGDGG